MLLNPSHTITFSGLPPDILDTYVRYKKGTRAIVKWLSQHAPLGSRDAYLAAKTLPINDLAQLARVASNHVQCMPEVIHFHFRETIAARSSLSKYFRKQTCGNTIDSSTVNHEHFTSSLTEIYASLCECCGEPVDYCRRPTKRARQKKEQLSNHFTHLSIEHCSCSDEEHEPVSPLPCEECDTGIPPSPCRSSTDSDFRLSGDDLSDAIETIAVVQQIHKLYQASQDVWRQAGAGGVSSIVAAAVTNVACASLLELETQLREMNPAVNLPSLHKTCGIPQGSSSIEYETGPSCENQHQTLEDMHTSWQALVHLKAGHIKPTTISCIHKPAEYLNSPDFVAMLTRGIFNLVSSDVTPDTVIRNGTPVYGEVGYLVTHPEASSNVLRSTLALHLLSISYKAYMSGSKDLSVLSGCRLSALKLSQQAQSSLSMVLTDKISFPCRCTETISFHLHQLRHTLQRYTAYKCWDAFFQAPWVAGNHTLEMLDMCFYYGMRLIRYRHYVGSVLHSYNVLKQMAAMEEIPLLEELCNKFANIFFPGGQRPTERFAASWARFVGARLKFKKGHKGHNHRESWCMAIPSHAAKRAAGFGIGNDGSSNVAEDTGISKIMDLKRMDYHVDASTWDVICDREDINRPNKRRSTGSDDGNMVFGRLRALCSYLAQDMQGEVPVFRLNLFAIFETCVKIVSSISKATHTDPKDKELRCICFATTILSGGDRIKNSEVLGRPDCWKKSDGEREVVEDAKKAIREVMAGVDKKDWLWEVGRGEGESARAPDKIVRAAPCQSL